MPSAADPVGTGLVTSLARPGGNVTGMSHMHPDLAGKRLELLTEILPKLSRVAFLGYAPGTGQQPFLKEEKDAAQRFGMWFQPLMLRSPETYMMDVDIETRASQKRTTDERAIVVWRRPLDERAKFCSSRVRYLWWTRRR